MPRYTKYTRLIVSLLTTLLLSFPGDVQATEGHEEEERPAGDRAAEELELAREAERLQEELDELSKRLKPDHPEVQKLHQRLRDFRAAHRQAAGDHARQRHIEQAIFHLRAAGLHELAQTVHFETHEKRPDRRPADPPEVLRHEQRNEIRHADPGFWRVLDRMREAIGHIESRVRESEEIRHAVEDGQRNLEHLQREFDMRLRDMEHAMRRHARQAERVIDEHSEELEGVIERVERAVDRKIAELEEQLADRREEHSHEADDDAIETD